MSILGFNTVPVSPNTRTSPNQSILWQLQYIPSLRLPSFIISDYIQQGEDAQRSTRYERGECDQIMSTEVRKILTERSNGPVPYLGANLQMPIVQTFVDRVPLKGVEAPGNEAGSKWCSEVWDYTRMDALQGDVHERTITVGNCYVMVWWDNELQQLRYTLEEAWDGTQGMIGVYRSKSIPVMDCAIKIWQIFLDQSLNVLVRVNAYFPDRCEKYFCLNQAPLQAWQGGDISIPQFKDVPTRPIVGANIVRGGNGARNYLSASEVSGPYESPVIHFEAEEPVEYYSMPNGLPLGIPVIHFRNRARHNYGISEIKSTMPIQDMMNRMMYSFLLTSEYNAFGVTWTRGFAAPDAIRPGTIIEISPDQPLTSDQMADMGRLPGEPMTPYLDALNWCTQMMGKISRTPSPEFATEAGRISGEALKQLEIGLVGKANRFKVKAGNAWEDVFMMGNRVQTAYGNKKPPKIDTYKSLWDSSEIRDDLQTVQGATMMRPVWGDKQTLRAVAPVYDLSSDDIESILDEKQEDAANKMAMMQTAPGFGAGGQMPPSGSQPGGDNAVAPMDTPDQGAMTSKAPQGKQEVTAQ